MGSRPQGSTEKYAATAPADIGIIVMRGNPIILSVSTFLFFFLRVALDTSHTFLSWRVDIAPLAAASA